VLSLVWKLAPTSEHRWAWCIIAYATLVVSLFIWVLPARAQEFTATWYGNEHGQSRRADGVRYNPWVLGFACRGWRLGSVHRVTNLSNGRSVVIPCNDRAGWGVPRGGVDLSRGAARALGVAGRARVRVE
jgi:rare lipoprotein A